MVNLQIVRPLVLVIVVAATVRMVFLLWSWSESPYLHPPSVLSVNYFKEGYAIAAGYGYVVAESPKGQIVLDDLYRQVTVAKEPATPDGSVTVSSNDLRPQMVHPPGVPLLIAALHRIFNNDAQVPLQIVGLVLDVAAAGIFWWVIAVSVGPRVGFFAGGLYALFPPLAYYSISNESDGLLAFFIVAALACTFKGSTTEGWRGLAWNGVAGVSIGVGAYIRPDYLFVPVIMFFGVWAYTRCFWRAVATLAITQVLALMLLLPWASRNYAVCGRWIFSSTSVGGTLYAGLGEFHNPWGIRVMDEYRTKEANAKGISNPWGCEGDQYFRRAFYDSVLEHPGAYLMTIVKRVPLVLATPYDFGFVNPLKTRTFSQARESGEDHYQVLLRQPGYVLAAYWDHLLMAGLTFTCLLATLIMLLRERWRWGLILLLLSPHLYSIGAHMLTHLEPRYLLPSMFCWFVGPAYILACVTASSANNMIRFTAGPAMLRSEQASGS